MMIPVSLSPGPIRAGVEVLGWSQLRGGLGSAESLERWFAEPASVERRWCIRWLWIEEDEPKGAALALFGSNMAGRPATFLASQ
jgi:hypothetical protein